MLKQDKVYLGDPDTVRDWVYVDDHVQGYLKALGNKKAIGQEIQLCTGKGYTTKETAELIAKQSLDSDEIITLVEIKKSEIPRAIKSGRIKDTLTREALLYYLYFL